MLKDVKVKRKLEYSSLEEFWRANRRRKILNILNRRNDWTI